MDYVTWQRPFQGHFVILRLGLDMFNPHIKFEMSTITCNKKMKGKAIVLSQPLGDIGVTYTVHLWLVGKRVVDFLLTLVERLSPTLTVEAL